MTAKMTREEMMALYDKIVPHLEAIEALFKHPKVTLLVRAPNLLNGDLLLTQDDETTIVEAVKRQLSRPAAIERNEAGIDIRHVI